MRLYQTLRNFFYVSLASLTISIGSGCATGPKFSPIQELEGKSRTIETRLEENTKEYTECTKLSKELGEGIEGLEGNIQEDENLLTKIDKAIESQDESVIDRLNREINEEIKKQRTYNGILGLGITTGYPLLDWGIITLIGAGGIWGQDEYRKQHHKHSTSQDYGGGGEGPGGPGGN